MREIKMYLAPAGNCRALDRSDRQFTMLGGSVQPKPLVYFSDDMTWHAKRLGIVPGERLSIITG